MPSPRVVEALDVIEHIRPGLVPRPVELAGSPQGWKLHGASSSANLRRAELECCAKLTLSGVGRVVRAKIEGKPSLRGVLMHRIHHRLERAGHLGKEA